MIDPRLADPITGRVDLARWAERVEVRAAVGTCRSCGGLLAGEPATPDPLTGLTDLQCRCLLCGAGFVQPIGRRIVTPNLAPA